MECGGLRAIVAYWRVLIGERPGDRFALNPRSLALGALMDVRSHFFKRLRDRAIGLAVAGEGVGQIGQVNAAAGSGAVAGEIGGGCAVA